ncbi:sucrose synthase [Medicago truncatula]|uniref:Sucrose synthase n=1 Tax=Medicago truncatula TaxID=3880 RepID=G7KYW0_MEDTR|nr:sucrose synthase [Medicago truncatula]
MCDPNKDDDPALRVCKVLIQAGPPNATGTSQKLFITNSLSFQTSGGDLEQPSHTFEEKDQSSPGRHRLETLNASPSATPWTYLRVHSPRIRLCLGICSAYGKFVVELFVEVEPFTVSFHFPTLKKTIGNDVKFLNRHLSSELFHDKEGEFTSTSQFPRNSQLQGKSIYLFLGYSIVLLVLADRICKSFEIELEVSVQGQLIGFLRSLLELVIIEEPLLNHNLASPLRISSLSTLILNMGLWFPSLFVFIA